MNLALLQQIVGVLVQAVELGIKYGPEILANIQAAFGFATSSDVLTPEQQTQVDATLDAANSALQAAVAAKEAPSDATPTV